VSLVIPASDKKNNKNNAVDIFGSSNRLIAINVEQKSVEAVDIFIYKITLFSSSELTIHGFFLLKLPILANLVKNRHLVAN
jgi:hypothetical protein